MLAMLAARPMMVPPSSSLSSPLVLPLACECDCDAPCERCIWP